MSGPKDFSIDFSPLLVDLFTTQRVEYETAFAARVQAARQSPRRRPAPRAPLQAPIIDAPAEPQRVAEESPAPARESAARDDARRAKEAARLVQELAEIHEAIEDRRVAITEDPALAAAAGDRLASWTDRCRHVVDLPPSPEAVRVAREALVEGETIVKHAIDVTQQVERRKHVQRAIVESFHAIGFFTDVAESADAGKPLTIVARKGAEEVTVSLPLGDGGVQSHWSGQTDERCVDSFLDYVAQMDKRGMQCRPSRSDLADRPALRQVGRKDLPRSSSRGG